MRDRSFPFPFIVVLVLAIALAVTMDEAHTSSFSVIYIWSGRRGDSSLTHSSRTASSHQGKADRKRVRASSRPPPSHQPNPSSSAITSRTSRCTSLSLGGWTHWLRWCLARVPPLAQRMRQPVEPPEMARHQ